MSLTRHSGTHLNEWLKYKAPNTFVAEISNTWSGTEATAYVLHTLTHYNEMAPKTVFLQRHDGSWHSRPVCHLLHKKRGNFQRRLGTTQEMNTQHCLVRMLEKVLRALIFFIHEGRSMTVQLTGK